MIVAGFFTLLSVAIVIWIITTLIAIRRNTTRTVELLEAAESQRRALS